MATDLGHIDSWDSLPWFTLEQELFRLQRRIYQASVRGDYKAIRNLQKLLFKSRAAKLIAVRRVTQDNQGKHTPGVDGVCSLPPEQRLELAANLKVGVDAEPVRRVFIPKPGTDELRPLGIPTLRDRALQTLVKFALEPEWEARFEPNSYGFRPGRSCWDAIQAIYNSIKQTEKYVLDADIAKCFDRIAHEALLKKVNAGPKVTRQLRAWLKAGVLDGDTLFPSEQGTPQGGTISPLLANIALHGMEDLLRQRFPGFKTKKKGYNPAPAVIRYADDFVVLHPSEEVVRECQAVIAEWLRGMGLELKPSKTRIGHTSREIAGRRGFDFLGFTARQFPAGKHTSCRNSRGQPTGFKLHIRPSRGAVKRHLAKLRETVRELRSAPQDVLIKHLNRQIRGWSNYYSTQVSKRTFYKVDHVLFRLLLRWAYRRHPNKGRKWAVLKYWKVRKGQGWSFQSQDGEAVLFRHAQTRIVRHVKVQDSRSPFDGDWAYWSSRMGRHPELAPATARLMKRQQGRCGWCGLCFKADDVLEVDHCRPKAKGGKDILSNFQLLHRHCHHEKTKADSLRGMNDNHQTTEERNDGKPSRSVLEPSRGSDTQA